MASPSALDAGSYSLRGRLIRWLLAAVAAAALIQGAIVYYAADSEADEIFDYHMQQVAAALRGGVPIGAPDPHLGHEVEEPALDLVMQVWQRDGTPLYASTARVVLPRQPSSGFSDVLANGARYRVFSLQTPTRVIQVAQDIAARRELARKLVFGTVAPVMLLSPVLMLTLWWVVTRSMWPLARARLQIARRAADELSPLSVTGLPDEIRPLVDETNLLFARLAEAFAAQTHFVADAAHELRSPLAALRLQVQSLQRANDTGSRALAERRLLAGLDRTARLVDQMLALARHDAASARRAMAKVDLRAIIAQTIGDLLPAAQQRHIDVGIADAVNISVTGEAEALRMLFRNLLENAIKYSPDGGTVDVSLRAEPSCAIIEIADSGTGIAEDARQRAFDRFYRVSGGGVAGSGLGLAIVQSIARRHQGTVTLDRSPRLGGLLVTVQLPVG